LLWTTRPPANRTALRLEFVRLFRLNRWLTYLIAVPLVIALTLLAIFFFATFLGLFAAVLAIAALRIWWLRDRTQSLLMRVGVATRKSLVELVRRNLKAWSGHPERLNASFRSRLTALIGSPWGA
jgi:hypothetical protein